MICKYALVQTAQNESLKKFDKCRLCQYNSRSRFKNGSAHPRNPKQRTKEFYLMLEHIKAFFAKLPVRNMSKRKVLATVSALVVIVSVVTITGIRGCGDL